jgi:hypothetical protein
VLVPFSVRLTRSWHAFGSPPQADTLTAPFVPSRRRKGDGYGLTFRLELEDGRIVCRARCWSARRDAPAHVVFADGRIDNDEAEAFIRGKLASRYRVEQVAYDQRFFEDQAKRLSDAGFVVTPMTPSADPTRKAWDPGWRVSKLKQTNRIDALAAVVLAAYFAAQDTTSVYQTRELLVGG